MFVIKICPWMYSSMSFGNNTCLPCTSWGRYYFGIGNNNNNKCTQPKPGSPRFRKKYQKLIDIFRKASRETSLKYNIYM